MKSSKNKSFQKGIFCPFCDKFQERLHYCQVWRRHINYDRFNKVKIVSKPEAGAQRKGDYEGDTDCVDSLISYRNVMDIDDYCRKEAEMWKKADMREQIEEEQKKDIQEFNAIMKTFSIDQKEVDGFKASLCFLVILLLQYLIMRTSLFMSF